jgi:hypothetical protein
VESKLSSTVQKALALLDGAEEELKGERALVGMDGFVDQIIRIVDKKLQDGTSTYLPKIPDWAARINAAAGKSTKFELFVQQTKLGGNAVIMANAMGTLSIPLTCFGNFGHPEVHPVFKPMESHCDVLSIAEPCFTDAMEFNDGKIMLSRQQVAADFTWKVLKDGVGEKKLFQLFDQSRFVTLTNWTAFPHMTSIWKEIQKTICPKLKKLSKPRKIFFDLSDPEYRLVEDIQECMGLISKYQQWFDATLGLNQKEAGEICDVLGISVKEKEDRPWCVAAAKAIRQKMGIDGIVIHAVAFAAAASANSSAMVEGPYIEKPLISTGAGDHFNAGYALGTILDGDLEQRLQLGVATSGFYVRTAKSPMLKDLKGFLKEIG